MFSDVAQYVRSLDRSIGVVFAGWLKHQKLSNASRLSAYAAAKTVIQAAAPDIVWRANPFESDGGLLDDQSTSTPKIAPEQIGSLVAACKSLLRAYRWHRREVIRARRTDAEVAQSLSQLVDVLSAQEDPTERLNLKLSREVLPTADVACSCFLLCVIHLGCNEQPLRELNPTGPWWSRNPFASNRRLLLLWKNRVGGRRSRSAAPVAPKLLRMSVLARPEFHPFKVMRFFGLLSSPLRKACRDAAMRMPLGVARNRLEALASSFWVFLGSSGKVMRFDKFNINRLMNSLLGKLASTTPELRTAEASALTYHAKAFRDAYFQFVMTRSGFDIEAGQLALHHSVDSTAISNYLNRTWVKDHVRDRHRRWQEGAFALLKDPDADLSPLSLRQSIDDAGKSQRNLAAPIRVPPRYRGNQVRHGYYCRDPHAPPIKIYRPTDSEDVCPAETCWDCSNARCYDDSLPELALDISVFKRERDECASHLWMGSEAEARLRSLEEVFSRWPEAKQVAAIEEAKRLER